MQIRDATPEDWPAIWPIVREVVRAAETYAYDPDLTEDEGREIWMLAPPARTVVAVDDDGTVLGTAKMHANRDGGGAHIATASFMVGSAAAGKGVGRALGEHVLDWARGNGFRGMQFNAVVESNTRAVKLWQAIGFDILATVPEAFKHPTQGYVGLHIMYQAF